MKIINWFILLFVIFLAISCNKEPESILGTLQYTEKELKVSSIFNDIEVLPLKGDYGLIKQGKVMAYYDKIICLDIQQRRLLFFNTDGEYLYEFSKNGEGYGEYRGINNYTVHDNQLVIFSHFEMAIHKYSLTGEFIEKITLPDRPYMVVFLKDVIIGYLNQNSIHKERMNIQVYDYDGNLLQQGFPYTAENQISVGFSGSVIADFQNYNNTFYYSPPLEPVIFKLDDKLRILSEFKVDGFSNFWPYGLTQDVYNFDLLLKHDYLQNFISKYGNHLFMTFNYNRIQRTGLIDFENNLFYKSFEPYSLNLFIQRYSGRDANGWDYFNPNRDMIYNLYALSDKAEDDMPQAIKDNFKNIMSEDFLFLIRKKAK
jgi:hypothetical protein